MNYEFVATKKFTRDVRRMKKRGADLSLLRDVIDRLLAGEALEPRYRDHALTGDYAGFRECHVRPDWLLVYMVRETELILVGVGTGSHSDLF